MRKELFAAIILAALAFTSTWNLKHIKSLTGELSSLMRQSYVMAAAGNWGAANTLAQKGADIWNSSDSYTHIFIRHSEVDLTTDAFGDYLTELYRHDIGGAEGTLGKLLSRLESIYEMERITVKSVF